MNKIFTSLLVLAAFAVQSRAADTTRVLFIGNSFTAVENVPGLTQGLAMADGKHMEILVHAPGGVSVGDVAQGAMAHMNNPIVFDLIRNNKIDYLVLQDNQGRFVDEGRFPDPTRSKVVEGHMKIRDSMAHYHPCAQMIFFAGWALKNCWPDVGDGEKCITNIYDNYLRLNGMMNEIVSPIGLAWLRSIDSMPGVDLWSPDEAHQSREGAFLTAATIFTTLYRINGEHISFDAGIDPATARRMRLIAYETVMDSIAPTGLQNFVPHLDYDGTNLIASAGFANYAWYRNDTLEGNTTTNSYTPATAGTHCYHVVGTNNDGCKQLSAANCMEVTTGLPIVKPIKLSVSPNPASNNLSISTGKEGSSKQYAIVNAIGKVVASGHFNSADTQLDIRALPAGIYLCKVALNGQISHVKFIIDR